MRERLCCCGVLVPLVISSFIAGQAKAGLLVFSHTGAADPVTEGWTYLPGPRVTVGPVFNDLGSGIDAWYVYDTGTRLGDLAAYRQVPSASVIALGNAYGWKLSAYIRVLAGSGATGGSPMVLYRDGSKSWQLHFGTTSGGDPTVQLVTAVSGSTPFGPTYTLSGGANQYHLYELVYDPTTGTADLYVDGALLHAGYVGYSYSNPMVYWGAGSSPDTGKAHFGSVEFYVNPEPASWALWGGLAAGVGFLLRRRNRGGKQFAP